MRTTIVVACKLIQLVFNIHWLVRSTAGPWYGVVTALMVAPLRLREKKINASYEHRVGMTLFGVWRAIEGDMAHCFGRLLGLVWQLVGQRSVRSALRPFSALGEPCS